MSLYYESAALLTRPNEQSSLKNLVFGNKSLKSNPVQCYALIVETVKWSTVLSSVIDNSKLLREELKLTASLALLLTHDLLLSKSGIAAGKNHVLRQSIERHKSRLTAELTRARVKAGFATVTDWRNDLNATSATLTTDSGEDTLWAHPRWIRINTIKSTIDAEFQNTFAGFELVQSLRQVLQASPTSKLLCKDRDVHNLVAVPHGLDLTKSLAYSKGQIIFQDKASCFPAVLLDLEAADGDILDACAAPGNKTTHLAALASSLKDSHRQVQIFACERDKGRAATLQKMVNAAVGASKTGCQIECLPGQDFLKLDPHDAKFSKVGAIVLDPSCSGSGIVGRDDTGLVPGYELVLPKSPDEIKDDERPSKKRKRTASQAKTYPKEANSLSTVKPAIGDAHGEADDEISKQYAGRLKALAGFQSSMIEHAFRFQSAHKIVYSTCSVHAEENEHVVVRALLSSPAREREWRICTRSEQSLALRDWHERGDASAIQTLISTSLEADASKISTRDIADACIRCQKGTEDGTMGFFAVMFVRDKPGIQRSAPGTSQTQDLSGRSQEEEQEEDEEWTGFSDDEDNAN